jgi:4-hydroxybutyrate CoA-transferase
VNWQEKYKHKLITAEQAAKLITPDSDVVFPMMDQPKDIGLEIAKRHKELSDVTLTSHWVEDYPFLHPEEHPEMAKPFLIQDAFPLRYTRKGVREKWIDWKPSIFGLSDGIRQLNTDRGKLYHYKDFFIFKLTPPDNAGYCSFGPHPWYSPSACRTARVTIAEIDPNLPWVNGEYVNLDEIDYLVQAPKSARMRPEDRFVPVPSPEEWEVAQVIGANAASLIKDGDSLEIGTGTASEAVMDFIVDRNDLGIDSELIYIQIIDLVKQGVITGKRKSLDMGKVVSSCLQIYEPDDPRGTEALEFVRGNPIFEFRDISTMCNVARLASQDNMVAINTAVAVDLLGQIVSTHIGSIPIAGPGGGVEYCIGAHYSKNGRSIIMLNSTAVGGKVSRIVPKLEPGTAVMIPMVYLDYLVTEYGVANLDCKSRRERAEALISVAHPDFQPDLRKAAKEMFYP